MLTLNQIVSLISNFATLDYRVNDFFFGDIWEYSTKKKDKFPVMLCTLKESRVTGKLDTFSFQIGFFDLVDKAETIELGVLSDTREMCKDCITYFNSPTFNDFLVNKNATLEDFTEKFDHEVSGHFFDLELTQQNEMDVCALPISGAPNYSSSKVVNIINQNGTVIATLVGGQSYQVEQLQQIIQTLGTAPTTITQTLT